MPAAREVLVTGSDLEVTRLDYRVGDGTTPTCTIASRSDGWRPAAFASLWRAQSPCMVRARHTWCRALDTYVRSAGSGDCLHRHVAEAADLAGVGLRGMANENVLPHLHSRLPRCGRDDFR